MAIVKVENPKRVLNTVYGGTAPLQGKLTAYLIRRGLHAKLEEARLIPAKIQSMHGAEKATALAELQETLRLLHESRADALEQLHIANAKAREEERGHVADLMSDLRQWKAQNEKRMAQLSARASRDMRAQLISAGGALSLHSPPPQPEPQAKPRQLQELPPPPEEEPPAPPQSQADYSRLGVGISAEEARRLRTTAAALDRPVEPQPPPPSSSAAPNIMTPARRVGGAQHVERARPEEGRSLRELQRELESLKSSLSVYLGSGL